MVAYLVSASANRKLERSLVTSAVSMRRKSEYLNKVSLDPASDVVFGQQVPPSK